MIQKNWQELIRPTQLAIKPGKDPATQAQAVAEPLERGFGLTLGNALRRVLLSSLQGAAITSVQIDNVLHEFSSVAGVREDVTDIVLNLKGVAINMEVEGPKRLSISATGPGIVTAGDISESAGITISLSPEDAVAYAARILQDQLQVFVNFDEPEQFRKLPEERQHRLYRRFDPKNRSRDAAHAELWAQILERNQGIAVYYGSASGHGHRGLATGQYRRSGQEVRRSLLRFG